MRVPEDYIMGTSDKSCGCGGSFWFFVISMILVTIGVFTGTMPIILTVVGIIGVVFVVTLVIIALSTGENKYKGISFKKKRKNQWTTPGGQASTLYLDILNESHVFVLGCPTEDRDNFRDGIIYTSLNYAPPELGLVLLDMVGFYLGKYKDLPHTLKYAHTLDDALKSLQEAIHIIDKRYKKYEKNNDEVFSAIWIVVDGIDHLISERWKETERLVQYILLRGRLANVHLLSFAAYCKPYGGLDERFSAHACLYGAPSAKIKRFIGFPNQPEPVHEVFYRGLTNDGGVYKIPEITDEEIAERISYWINQSK